MKISSNDRWIIEAGGAVIDKKVRDSASLSPLEKLIYCLWVADYGMRNAGDLDTATDLYKDFQAEGARLAKDLSLLATYQAFSLPKSELQNQYFDRFDVMCDEIKSSRAGMIP